MTSDVTKTVESVDKEDAGDWIKVDDVAELDAAVSQKLTNLILDPDIETAHVKADKILCDLLSILGCSKTVDQFEKIDKYYA